MKKLLSIMIALCVIFTSSISNKAYANQENVQAAWLTTAWNIDWPRSGSSAATQQQDMISALDTLKDTGINTVMFQVRPMADALYDSSINPWSKVLTGTQGKSPGYDPLEFVVQEAHKRGMKVHAWLNPYRVISLGTDVNVLSSNHPARNNPSWTLIHNNSVYYNPELPQVKQHISNTVAEIVTNYSVDGIVFDDYFYPTDYPLPVGESKNGAVANARREHINQMILQVKNRIKNIRSSVQFGASPRGVWKNKNSDSVMGSDTGYAKESYYSDYADTVKWIKESYVDYVIPQVYWEMEHNVVPDKKVELYKTVTDWWVNIAQGSNVKLYIGHTTDKDVVAAEIDKQLQYNRQYSIIKGSTYYNTKSIMENNQGARDKIKNELMSNASLSDISGHWAQVEIMNFVENGFVNGRPDGTFGPNDNITRAEFVKILNRVFGLTSTSGVVFNDTVGHWARKEIDIAVTNGVAQGRDSVTFGANDNITRQEAAKMLANYKHLSDTNHDKIQVFPDYNQVDRWAVNELEAIVEVGYIKGTGEGKLAPKANMSRAQAVVMLSRVN
jgi:uncharacterized lipoprotein YddW (UPF0748 family)